MICLQSHQSGRQHARDDYNEGGNAVNLAIAAFTTSHARMRLLKPMEKLGFRVCYCDTDSLMYPLKPGDWDVPKGNMLGDWDNQLKKAQYIESFVSCGSKVTNYQHWKNETESKRFNAKLLHGKCFG